MNLLEQLEFHETSQIPIEIKKPIRFTSQPTTSLWQFIDLIAKRTGKTRNDVIRVLLNYGVEQYFVQTHKVANGQESEDQNDVG